MRRIQNLHRFVTALERASERERERDEEESVLHLVHSNCLEIDNEPVLSYSTMRNIYDIPKASKNQNNEGILLASLFCVETFNMNFSFACILFKHITDELDLFNKPVKLDSSFFLGDSFCDGPNKVDEANRLKYEAAKGKLSCFYRFLNLCVVPSCVCVRVVVVTVFVFFL